MERTGMSAAQMRRELNADSGLLGLSGRSADMRELLALAQGGDASAAWRSRYSADVPGTMWRRI